jgi:hypothetical protein
MLRLEAEFEAENILKKYYCFVPKNNRLKQDIANAIYSAGNKQVATVAEGVAHLTGYGEYAPITVRAGTPAPAGPADARVRENVAAALETVNWYGLSDAQLEAVRSAIVALRSEGSAK